MTKGYNAGSELRPCLRCGSRKYWFDDEADEWTCWICVPSMVENVIRLELKPEFAEITKLLAVSSPLDHPERMDVGLVCSFRLISLFRRQTGSVKKSVPVPKEIGFLPDEVVRTDFPNVFSQHEAVAGDDQFVDCRVSVRLVADVSDNRKKGDVPGEPLGAVKGLTVLPWWVRCFYR
jgi:hypothetical protein